MIDLTAVVLTKNEEKNIGRCIKALSFCDEIIVIDDCSVDETTKIARNLGAKVFLHELTDSFSDQRNFGLKKVKSRWALFVDADEIITSKLKTEILNELKKKINYISGYYFKRSDFMWGRWIKYGEIGTLRFLRLAQKNSGRWERRVHERWHIVGDTKELKNHILHYPHPNIKNFLEEINERSALHALANKEEEKQANIFLIIFMPLYKFINGYIINLGFLDGTPGFIIAIIMSLHSFLSWSKLWFLQKN